MLSRRRLLQSAFASVLTPALRAAELPRSKPPPRPKPATRKIAVVASTYHYLSHAYHICGRFLFGYLGDRGMHYPDFGIAGMYVEQTKEGDLSRELARKHGFTLFPDIAGALTLGTKHLAVDGVALLGAVHAQEHERALALD